MLQLFCLKLKKVLSQTESESSFIQENTPPTDYPKHFVENFIVVELKTLMVVVENALSLKFSTLIAKVQQRPSANAIK